MTGEQWLERVFERGLRIGTGPRELVGGLRALVACRVLADDVAADAEQRLHERFAALRPRAAELHTAMAAAPDEPQVPLALLAPATMELVDADGITVALTAVELWPQVVIVHLEGVRSPLRDERDARHVAAFEQWAEHVRASRAAGEEPQPPPAMPGELLMRLPLTLADDAGTVYRRSFARAGGSGTEWLSQWAFAPGPPAEAKRLTVTVEGRDCVRHALDVALPPASADAGAR